MKYRSKPFEVEAFLYQGPSPEFAAWTEMLGHDGAGIEPGGNWGEDHVLVLHTIQGEWVNCPPGEWIMCEPVPGRYYPCADEVFQAKYVPVDEAKPFITYKRADGELIFGEYAFVCDTEYFDDADEPIEVIKETWQLVTSETLTLYPSWYEHEPDTEDVETGDVL